MLFRKKYRERLARRVAVPQQQVLHHPDLLRVGVVPAEQVAARVPAADAGAAALSVLTEPTRFGGSDEDLEVAARIGARANSVYRRTAGELTRLKIAAATAGTL